MVIRGVVALALSAVAAIQAASQIPGPSPDGFQPALAADRLPPSTPRVMADSRSPPLAGALSFFFPFGTGSFYAGHVAHGVRHLLITTVATSVLIVSAVHDVTWWGAGDGRVWGWERPALVVLGVNWIWGTETAVNDARAYNRRHLPRTTPRSTPRLGIRLPPAASSSVQAPSIVPALLPR